MAHGSWKEAYGYRFETKDKVIVITVTGHGLKDIPYALEAARKPVVVPVNVKAAAKALGFS